MAIYLGRIGYFCLGWGKCGHHFILAISSKTGLMQGRRPTDKCTSHTVDRQTDKAENGNPRGLLYAQPHKNNLKCLKCTIFKSNWRRLWVANSNRSNDGSRLGKGAWLLEFWVKYHLSQSTWGLHEQSKVNSDTTIFLLKSSALGFLAHGDWKGCKTL